MNAANRNDPCWCGSGKKLKHCHRHVPERPLTFRENIEWGLRHALTYAVGAAVWVTFTHAILGADFSSVGLTYPQLLAVYLALGLAVGCVLGLLRPYATRSRFGAGLTGSLGAFTIYFSLFVMFGGSPFRWQWPAWFLLGICMVVGFTFGLRRWNGANPR